MNHLASTYKYIADILSFETSNSKLENTLNSTSLVWDDIVREGSKHLVLPALYCRLESRKLLTILPKELELYLEEITTINRNRNIAILKQVYSISMLLTSHNIDHVFLKGSAILALGCYNDNAERMIGDIDILITKSQLEQAFELIRSNGYSNTYGFAFQTINFRHLARLINPNELAAIELHSELLTEKYNNLLNVNDILKSKRFANTIAIPSEFYIYKHQILAWQHNDNGHYFNAVSFKSLYETIQFSVHTNNELISELLKEKLIQSYFELGCYYFTELDILPLKKKFYLSRHLKYLKKPIYIKLLKPIKHFYLYTKTRTRLILKNKYYRKHILKKIFF